MAHIFVILSFIFIFCCHGLILDHLLTRNVSSNQIMDKDDDGNCYFPPFCHLNTSKCNIPRIDINDLSMDTFYKNYYIPKKPVIIQLCPDPSNHCNLSQIIDNSSHLFKWNRIVSLLRSEQDYKFLLDLEMNGTPKDRANTIDIHPLKDKERKLYKQIIDGITPPNIFSQMDMFNELNAFLSTSDGPMMSNKWIIFGTAGGGARFHFDYYLTSFWNMIVEGAKYWILTEPFDTLSIWNHSDDAIKGVMNLSINDFFADIVLNGFLEQEFERISNSNSKDKNFYFECRQMPGDILYAPPIYYHATVNLERTLSVSRNMITERDYAQSFNFLTRMISLKSRASDNSLVGIYQSMELCAALYHFDANLFHQSSCWTKEFLDNLNHFNDEVLVRKYIPDWFKFHEKYHSEMYIKMLNWAREHPQMQSFRFD